MLAPKRTPGQPEKDREILSEMGVQKVSQRIMPERLGISQSQVFREIQKLKQRWQESADCNTKEVIADSLAELRYCKARLWESAHLAMRPQKHGPPIQKNISKRYLSRACVTKRSSQLSEIWATSGTVILCSVTGPHR